MSAPPETFYFVCCQVGAESVLKAEFLQEMPQWRSAFSRPGFVTFKSTKPSRSSQPQLKSIFARSYGTSAGKISADNQCFERACALLEGHAFDHVHVWPRDRRVPGDHGFLPGATAESNEVGEQLIAAAREHGLVTRKVELNRGAKIGQRVLDCILVEPKEWWIGFHTAECFGQQWPGGVVPVDSGVEMISRAYLKMDEALRWSDLPIQRGDPCVEIGSAPGGSCQLLLKRGLNVTGIDPAEMDPRITSHPRFTHIRKRGADVRRRDYGKFKWLMADTNVAPKHTLDTVESIVTHPATNIYGMLLTLKIAQWHLVQQIPEYIKRVRSWGFEHVRCRQLAYQRQEICVAALLRRGMRRPRRVKAAGKVRVKASRTHAERA